VKHFLLIIILLFSFFNLTTTAQLPVKQQREIKPSLFSHLTEKIEIPEIFLRKFFELKAGDSFSVAFSPKLSFHGFVLEKVSPSVGTISMNLRLKNYKDALFNLTITTTSENQSLIRARIIHRNFSDVLLLVYENGRYFLEKQEQRLVLAE
jgi:hypothetical protein